MDFIFKGEARSIALQFNTVMKRDYLRAIQDILIAIDGGEKLVIMLPGDKEEAASRLLSIIDASALAKNTSSY
jgi:hypothetical protein